MIEKGFLCIQFEYNLLFNQGDGPQETAEEKESIADDDDTDEFHYEMDIDDQR